ncbi:type II toxin-antitoxin system YafQ family toxin [Prevotellamassilia timonensis]|uniref:type II toxin-antitoxin system YafQ family toxin n=1 Tax=Prevotellamassilia timonensis TaxID=1852370 RepID=UPI0023F4CC8A|nr:type II toxin-antitoxin system YafQ family toxin [Prevotellamassilia timonensis]MDD7440550.1 type II toxin-antitoxin system YafQ family toxin [Prevotellamassilia timonensis]
MMKEIRKTSQFKKDFKRFSKDPKKVNLLYDIVLKLAKGEEIPPANKPHMLSGEWQNFMECHIGGDYLLIWYDKEVNVIKLVRLGSHSELFGKGKKR